MDSRHARAIRLMVPPTPNAVPRMIETGGSLTTENAELSFEGLNAPA